MPRPRAPYRPPLPTDDDWVQLLHTADKVLQPRDPLRVGRSVITKGVVPRLSTRVSPTDVDHLLLVTNAVYQIGIAVGMTASLRRVGRLARSPRKGGR